MSTILYLLQEGRGEEKQVGGSRREKGKNELILQSQPNVEFLKAMVYQQRNFS